MFNTPGAFINEVADGVIAYAILLTRDLHLIDQPYARLTWSPPEERRFVGKRSAPSAWAKSVRTWLADSNGL